MMYQEFNRLAGREADPDMYRNEIEPTYMAFDWMSKEAMVCMYWGDKRGAYGLWLKGNALRREKIAIRDAELGEEYMEVWNRKAAEYRNEVEKLMA